jgi:hypothetical protein
MPRIFKGFKTAQQKQSNYNWVKVMNVLFTKEMVRLMNEGSDN